MIIDGHRSGGDGGAPVASLRGDVEGQKPPDPHDRARAARTSHRAPDQEQAWSRSFSDERNSRGYATTSSISCDKELVGPSPGHPAIQINGEEILRPQDPPRQRYSAGILFPMRAPVLSQDENAEGEDIAGRCGVSGVRTRLSRIRDATDRARRNWPGRDAARHRERRDAGKRVSAKRDGTHRTS